MSTINGKNISLSGSLVIPPNSECFLDLPIGRFGIIFKSGDKVDVVIDSESNEIVFTNADNPLGISSRFDQIPLNVGSVSFYFMVHAVGEGENITRLLSYTVAI